MKDLKEKLRDIIMANGAMPYGIAEQRVAQILKAFRDAKWLEPNTDRHTLQEMINKAISEQPEFEMPFMTGQEWYDRTIKEFLKVNRLYETDNPDDDEYVAKFSDFVVALKRAAGIKE